MRGVCGICAVAVRVELCVWGGFEAVHLGYRLELYEGGYVGFWRSCEQWVYALELGDVCEHFLS